MPTVLIVDDEPANIDLMTDVLSDSYTVRAAINGEAAMKAALLHSPDLILLDIKMPGLNGYEVCHLLKQEYDTRHIPVIFVTALLESADEAHGLELGAVDYITKPISPAILTARVSTHIALHNQHRELERLVLARTHELQETRLQIIQRLGRAAEYKDDATGLHVVRMSHYARILGRAAGMSETEAECLLHAAPMHDIGKIGVPDYILRKEGRLDEGETAIMRKHCEIGAQIIGDDPSTLLQMARSVALTHHEKWNGSGYPKGLKGEEIPLVGRITAIADVFDALTSERPYKEAWPVAAAVSLLETSAGEHFDPNLVPLFIDCMPEVLVIMAQYSQ